MAKGQSKPRDSQPNEGLAIKNWPVSERPREKLLQLGPEGLLDGELLAVLLRIGAAGQSAEDPGRQLISQFTGIKGIDPFRKAHTVICHIKSQGPIPKVHSHADSSLSAPPGMRISPH